MKHAKGYFKTYYARHRAAVLWYLGNRCYGCGINDSRVLQIDHRYGGGRKESIEFNGNKLGYYKRILSEPERYQVLCANCNWIKKFEQQEL